jgi:hypothetical protein
MRALLVLLALLVPAAPAAAQAPANDSRTSPQELGNLPASTSATTGGATRDPQDPVAACGCDGPSLWYRYVASVDGRVALTLEAGGDLDAVVSVFGQARSQLTAIDEDLTDAQGKAGLGFAVRQGRAYLVRVAQQVRSAPGRFALTLSASPPAVRGPGRALPADGVTDVLDRVLRPAAAYDVRLREGTTYRFNVVPRGPATDDEDDLGCRAQVALFPPGTTDFDDAEPVWVLPCDGYRLFTPARGGSGRWVLRALAPRGSRGAQRFHLQAAPADRTDTAPGTFLGNGERVPARLRGSGVDRVDLYRFQLADRSQLRLVLSSSAELGLDLRNERGRVIESSDDGAIRRELRPGRYFVYVRAPAGVDARYVLRRASRAITRASISTGRARAPLGQAVTVTLRVRPGFGGPSRVTIQRFDPEAGWQYYATRRPAVRGGAGSFGFVAPSVGRWRVRGEFLGTPVAAPSDTGFAAFLVTGR